MRHPLIGMIDRVVEPTPKPAIYIGGGIDSAVVLYHLSRKSPESIHSYSFVMPELGYDESEDAERVATHFGTKHNLVVIRNLLEHTRSILSKLRVPRFSVWVYWTAEKVKADGRENLYIGEGGDEHFGGYWYKPNSTYLQNWAGLFVYGLETYKMIHDLFSLKLHFPYMSLDIADTRQFYDENHEKRFLREAYSGILPDFILKKRKQPAGPNEQLLWKTELAEQFPEVHETLPDEQIRWYWNVWVMKEWLIAHRFI